VRRAQVGCCFGGNELLCTRNSGQPEQERVRGRQGPAGGGYWMRTALGQTAWTWRQHPGRGCRKQLLLNAAGSACSLPRAPRKISRKRTRHMSDRLHRIGRTERAPSAGVLGCVSACVAAGEKRRENASSLAFCPWRDERREQGN
jgi:hypothetical protein